MYCGNCGNEVSEINPICSACGLAPNFYPVRPDVEYITEQLPLRCENCGRESRDQSRFCGGCGQPLPEVQERKLPLCVQCGTVLEEGYRVCKSCGLVYKEAPDGYIRQEETCCGSCGATLTFPEPYCNACGVSLSGNRSRRQKRLVVCCPDCGQEKDYSANFCIGCGAVSAAKKVKPIILGNRLVCPNCGESSASPERTVCFHCGTEFLATPWVCGDCGKTNRYGGDKCLYCRKEERSATILLTERAEKSAQEEKQDKPEPPKKPKAPSISDYPMKWYYFMIYGLLIVSAVGSFISSLISFADGSVIMGLISIAIGIDALVTRSALANLRSSGPGQLLAYFAVSYGVNIVDCLIEYNDQPILFREMGLGDVYLWMVAIYLIAALIQIGCNASYFGKRKPLFTN